MTNVEAVAKQLKNIAPDVEGKTVSYADNAMIQIAMITAFQVAQGNDLLQAILRAVEDRQP